MRSAYRRLVEMKKAGTPFMVGFIADQRPTGLVQNNHTIFLNQPATYLAGGETIGRRVDANYLYLDIEKVKRGHYVLKFKKIEPVNEADAEYPYTLGFLRLLEENIRREPRYWLWSHNRWKHKV